VIFLDFANRGTKSPHWSRGESSSGFGVRHVAEVIVLPGVLIGRVDIAVITVTDVEVGEDRLVNGGTGGTTLRLPGMGVTSLVEAAADERLQKRGMRI